MKHCSKCGATIADEAQFCSSCSASQAGGMFNAAEIMDKLGRGALRSVLGGIYGAFGGALFYFILFFYPSPALKALGISALIFGVIGAVFSAPSPKFTFLMGYWGVYGLIGYIIFGITMICFQTFIIGRIIYIFLLIIMLPLTWIWYITKRGLVTTDPKKVGILKLIKEELTDTIKEVKRFGRR